jgi:hypothetical protein
MIPDAFTIAGVVGTMLVVSSYFGNQQGWLTASDWRYPFANLVGASFILVSLLAEWNLPTLIIESFWAAISIYGLIRVAMRPAI